MEYPLRPPLFSLSLYPDLSGGNHCKIDDVGWTNELRAMEAEVMHISVMTDASKSLPAVTLEASAAVLAVLFLWVIVRLAYNDVLAIPIYLLSKEMDVHLAELFFFVVLYYKGHTYACLVIHFRGLCSCHYRYSGHDFIILCMFSTSQISSILN